MKPLTPPIRRFEAANPNGQRVAWLIRDGRLFVANARGTERHADNREHAPFVFELNERRLPNGELGIRRDALSKPCRQWLDVFEQNEARRILVRDSGA